MNDPELEVLSPADDNSALAALQRSETESLVATARKYPRNIKQFITGALSEVTAEPEIAEACFYKLKRRNPDGTEKVIEGPSVRLLEIAAAHYCNLTYGARVISEDDRFIVAQGVAIDYQRNVRQTLEVRRRITNKHGKKYSDDMVGTTANAACSIAKRNALNGIVPRVYINQFFEAAKKCAVGDIKSLGERRQKAVAYFTATLGVPLEKVLAYLNRTAVEEINLDDLEILTGLKTALKEGDETLENAFPTTPKANTNAPDFGKPAAPAADAKAEADAGLAPAATEPTKEAKKAPPKSSGSINYVKGVRSLIALAKIDEALVIAAAHASGMDETVTTLEQMAIAAPARLQDLYDNWAVISKGFAAQSAQ